MTERTYVDVDTYRHQKKKFHLIHDHLNDPEGEGPKRKTGPRRKENESRLLTLIMGGALPWSSAYHPEGYSETWGINGDYFLQNFFSMGEQAVENDFSAVDMLHKKAHHQKVLAKGIGKPSATDGSKGQWRAYHRNIIKCCDWFLGEWGGDEWMMNSGLSKAPDGWAEEVEAATA